MNLEELRNNYKPAILALAERHHIENVRVFGSVMRGESTPASDVDFLVHLKEGASLFELGGFYYDLENLLGCKVDVVPDTAELFYDSIATEAALL